MLFCDVNLIFGSFKFKRNKSSKISVNISLMLKKKKNKTNSPRQVFRIIRLRNGLVAQLEGCLPSMPGTYVQLPAPHKTHSDTPLQSQHSGDSRKRPEI